MTEQPTPTRPGMLTFLCILTFVGSGASSLANLMLFAFFDSFKLVYEQGGLTLFAFSSEQEKLIELLLSAKPVYFLYQGLLYAVSLVGAVFMWNLNKKGIHFYAIGQILLLIMQQIFMPSLPFPAFELLIAVLFIVLYARFLPVMK